MTELCGVCGNKPGPGCVSVGCPYPFDAPAAAWMADKKTRAPWVANSLRSRMATLREAARLCRKSFRKEFMNTPACWLADVYEEAAAVMERRLAEIDAAPAALMDDMREPKS